MNILLLQSTTENQQSKANRREKSQKDNTKNKDEDCS